VVPSDIIGLIAASAAVHISDIPFAGPIAGVRVCFVDGAYAINPTHDQIKRSKLEIVVAGTAEGITMVEGTPRKPPKRRCSERSRPPRSPSPKSAP
jgi:polyribonucleotide nucleotidyltransferase